MSGIGDDANPCSRTVPCKTFAGAISKMAAAGEINCLDPDGFGAVTITRSMTINCHEVFGSVLVSGTNGIVIAAAASDRVILRNLQIQGLNTGLPGIRIQGAASVSIEDCVVSQFTQQGIVDVRTGGTKLFVRNTTQRQNAGAGIAVAAAATNNTELENVYSVNNQFGVATGAGNNTMIRRSVFSGNSNAGAEADSGGQLTADDSVM